MLDERFPKWDIDVDKGEIYSLRLQRYIGSIDKDGYVQVGRYNKNFKQQKLHQYIWMCANKADIPKGFDIHHIDGNKLNNNINNLELVEHNVHTLNHNKEKKIIFISENNPFYGKHHTEETKRKISEANKGNQYKSKQVMQLTLDGELVKIWCSANECKRNGFNQGAVSACCRGEIKKYKNYIWKYLDNGKQYE